MPRSLLTLPLEVQRLIFEHILHPGDLKALCLVSKQLSDLAIERLYPDLLLPYDGSDREWTRLTQLSESRGLRHVRTIDIGSSEAMQHGFCKPVGNLIFKLPPDSLTRFRFGSLGRPLPEALRHLWHTQKTLTNLQLDFMLNAPTIDEIVQDEARTLHSLQGVSELEINFGSDETTTPNMYDCLVSLLQFPKLKKVTVLHPSNDEVAKPRLMDRLLHQLLPQTLTHLSLSYISLSPENHLQLDDFRVLRHLELRECYLTCNTLRSYHHPTLSSLALHTSMKDIPSSPEYMDAVISFVHRCESLRRLIADVQVHSSQTGSFESALRNNAQSLEELYINVQRYGSYQPIIINPPWSCRKLAQLALYYGNPPRLEQCKALAYGLPSLRMLNIIEPFHALEDFPYKDFASKIFGSVDLTSKLSLVVFGARYSYWDRLEWFSHGRPRSRQCFFCPHPHNEGKCVQVKASQARYWEPSSDLLEVELVSYVQGRAH